MSRKKSTLSLNINNNKNWNSSWSSYIQQEYRIIFQENIMLQVYLQFQLKDLKKINIIGLRFYKINRLFLIDISISGIKFVTKKVLLSLAFFFKQLVKFFETDVCIAIYRPFLLDFLNNGFNIALKIAKLIERRIKFRSKLVKTF